MVRAKRSSGDIQLLERHRADLISLRGVSVKDLSESRTISTQDYVMATELRVYGEYASAGRESR